MRTHPWSLCGTVACLFLAGATAVLADPQPQPLLDTFVLEGRYYKPHNGRETEAKLTVSQTEEGTLQVTRTARYVNWLYQNEPTFTWSTSDASRKWNWHQSRATKSLRQN